MSEATKDKGSVKITMIAEASVRTKVKDGKDKVRVFSPGKTPETSHTTCTQEEYKAIKQSCLKGHLNFEGVVKAMSKKDNDDDE